MIYMPYSLGRWLDKVAVDAVRAAYLAEVKIAEAKYNADMAAYRVEVQQRMREDMARWEAEHQES